MCTYISFSLYRKDFENIGNKSATRNTSRKKQIIGNKEW